MGLLVQAGLLPKFPNNTLDEGAGPVLDPGTLRGQLLPSHPVRLKLLATGILG